jgi:hypothetical protein
LTVNGNQVAEQTLNQSTLFWMQAVLNNWEAACRRSLHIAPEPLPWIIFYDENQAWHLKPEEHLLPPHQVSAHSLKFVGRTYSIFRVEHQDGGLWVPGREALKINVASPPVTTMPYDKDRKSFFIVALPALYHRLAGSDQAANLDELFLGLTAHELTHTRQLIYGMQQIKRLRAGNKLPESFDDNIIQQEFGTNDEYKMTFEKERKLLTSAVLAQDIKDCRQKVEEVLSFNQKRKERFFTGEKKAYSHLEDIFLALESTAMWVQYQAARDRAPAGEDWLKTLIKLSENTDSWSQEEGLALFLLIDRLVPGWQKRFLAQNFPSPFAVLREAVDKPVKRESTTRLRKGWN